jgi:hypothetical protein
MPNATFDSYNTEQSIIQYTIPESFHLYKISYVPELSRDMAINSNLLPAENQ